MGTRITFDLGDSPEDRFISGDGRGHGDFVCIDLTPDVHAFAYTPAQCDALIKAAVAAKDLLLGAQEDPTAPDAADHTGPFASVSSEPARVS